MKQEQRPSEKRDCLLIYFNLDYIVVTDPRLETGEQLQSSNIY